MLTVEDVVASFNRPVLVNEHGCWLWMGATDRRGYARFSGQLVHGWTFMQAGFECGEGKEICHKCPNHNCVNPDHMYAGTHYENMQDAARAGVMGWGRKVTDKQLAMIPVMLAEGRTQKEICKAIGVTPSWFTQYQKGRYKYAKSK